MGVAVAGNGDAAFAAADGAAGVDFKAGEGLAVDAAFVATEVGATDGDFDAAGVGLESGVPGRGYCPELRSDGIDTTGSLGDDSSVARKLSFSSGVGDSS